MVFTLFKHKYLIKLQPKIKAPLKTFDSLFWYKKKKKKDYVESRPQVMLKAVLFSL